jgi:aryl-alcohol dehydrogenase-like predicted oxidoreductase
MTLRPEPYLHLSTERVFRGLAALEAAARERGVATSTLALAWVLAQPGVAAAVIGPRKPSHLEQALAAFEVRLTHDEAARLAKGL